MHDTLYLDQTIDTSTRWAEVPHHVYTAVHEVMTELTRGNMIPEDKMTMAVNILANNLHLIYERLYLKSARDINYRELKDFATANRALIQILFNRVYPGKNDTVLKDWVQPEVDALECALYRPSTRHNKHIFH